MTTPGVTLEPEEPDRLEPAGLGSASLPAAPPAAKNIPVAEANLTTAESRAIELNRVTEADLATEDNRAIEADRPTEEIRATEDNPAVEADRATDDDRANEEGPTEEAPVREPAPRADDLELELRGGLTVAKRVVEKIAEQAASEVTGNGEHQAAFAVRPGATAIARPTVEVQLEGADAWVSIDVGLTYPTPLRAAADELRAHLVERLEQLSGVTVKRLDIRISWLGATAKQPRRLQ